MLPDPQVAPSPSTPLSPMLDLAVALSYTAANTSKTVSARALVCPQAISMDFQVESREAAAVIAAPYRRVSYDRVREC